MKHHILRLLKHQETSLSFLKHHIKKTLCILILISIYGVLFLFRYEIQAQLFFPGVRVNTLDYTGSGVLSSKLKFEDINIVSSVGENINGLYVTAGTGTGKTIYYFHGNGGDLRYFYPTFEFLSDLGYNVLAFDYPGYGKSSGFPYNNDVSLYAKEFYNQVQQQKGFKDDDITVWGYSIGSGVALDWAKGKDISAMVLAAPYSSFYGLSREHYTYALQKLLFLPDSFVSSENIESIKVPTLFLHGNADTLISIEQGREVFLSAGDLSYFLELDTGTHFDILETPFAKVQVAEFLSTQKLKQRYIFAYQGISVTGDNTGTVFDFESDASLTKYVDPSHSFAALSYVPDDLEFFSRSYISDSKGDATLRHEARFAFENLARAFYQHFGEKISIVSSYRSYNYQVGIKAGGCPDNLCARAGYSEHQSGLALDLWSASSNETWKANSILMSYYNWLSQNAHLYGFHNSYQKGKTIDGYEIEPWHWRYLGVELATILKEKNMTFAQYHTEKNPKQ